MAGVTGLEPATSGVTGRRSNQLSYTPAKSAGRMYAPPFAKSRRRPSAARYVTLALIGEAVMKPQWTN